VTAAEAPPAASVSVSVSVSAPTGTTAAVEPERVDVTPALLRGLARARVELLRAERTLVFRTMFSGRPRVRDGCGGCASRAVWSARTIEGDVMASRRVVRRGNCDDDAGEVRFRVDWVRPKGTVVLWRTEGLAGGCPCATAPLEPVRAVWEFRRSLPGENEAIEDEPNAVLIGSGASDGATGILSEGAAIAVLAEGKRLPDVALENDDELFLSAGRLFRRRGNTYAVFRETDFVELSEGDAWSFRRSDEELAAAERIGRATAFTPAEVARAMEDLRGLR
jgi:hypothetical protein